MEEVIDQELLELEFADLATYVKDTEEINKRNEALLNDLKGGDKYGTR